MSEYDAIRKKIDAARKDLLQRRQDHPVLDADGFESRVRRSLAGIERFITDAQAGHPKVLGDDPDVDAIRDRWDELLAGRIGARLEIDETWRKQADIRYEEEIPPGFEDRKKDRHARRYGDLIVWFELLEHVKRSKEQEGSAVPVIFVTDDTKRDWWRSAEGRAVGPAPPLTEELATAGGEPFWMYSVARFVEEAAARKQWDIAPEGPQELRSAAPESAGDVAPPGGDSGTSADDCG
jgi:hypothetical protein